ncbi:MAG: hypothetical protein QOE41_2722 [Mycobacterium sp.]|jgi:hypothetical protein|nr:hypothetical protein [Mycobacterium sp.]
MRPETACLRPAVFGSVVEHLQHAEDALVVATKE